MLNENYFLSLYFVWDWNRFYTSGHDRSPGILIGRLNASSDWSNDRTLIVGAGLQAAVFLMRAGEVIV